MIAAIQAALIGLGCLFFLAGTIAMLRFPDTYTRIHALTKADNLGFGLVVLGLLPSAGSVAAAGKLVLIWLLVLASSATAAHLMAQAARQHGTPCWQPSQPAQGSRRTKAAPRR